MGLEERERYRIHCGSSVTVSPGVMIAVPDVFGRLEGGSRP